MAATTADGRSYPGQTTEAHPEVFDSRAKLPQPTVLKAGQLPEELIDQYFEKGFLVIEDFFKDSELQPLCDSVSEIVDLTAEKLYQTGRVKDRYKEYGFTERLTKLEADYKDANILCSRVTAVPKSLKDLWTNPRLLNLIEQLIGPDITGSPVWNLRTKVPQTSATTVPWHQDVSYLDNDTYKMLIPTVWIPLVDATEENGCLEVTEGGHKTGRVANHLCCWKDTLFTYIQDGEMENTLGVDVEKQTRLCDVKSGGLVLFSNIIPHRSLPNVSKGIRWSVDFRFHRSCDPDGLWGLKKGVVMRSSEEPNMKVDWTEFDAVDRHRAQVKYTTDKDKKADGVEFDSATPGPWMKQWPIVHINKHVERFLETHPELRGKQ